MAISIVQSASGISATATVTLNFGVTPTNGNLLVAASHAGGNNVSLISGWTQAVAISYDNNNDQASWLYKLAGGSEPTAVTATSTGAVGMDLHIWEVSGAGVLDVTASVADSGTQVTTRSAGTTGTLVNASEIVFAAIGLGNPVTALSWTNSFTSQFDTSQLSTSMLVVSSTASVTTMASWTTLRHAVGLIVSFKPSPLPAPTVSTVAPTGGSTTGGTSVTLTGTNFVGGATVTVGGVSCTSIVVVSATKITCVTGAHAAGVVNIVVTNPDTQTGTLSSGFTYSTSAPTVTAISPTSGTTGGGTSVTVTGTGFVATPTITIGGDACTSVVWVSATSLTAVTGVSPAGVDDVVVTNPDIQIGTLANGYTYTVPSGLVSPTVLQSVSGTSATATVTQNWPAAVTAGNLLVAIVANNGTIDPTIDGGVTQIWQSPQFVNAGASNVLTLTVFYRIAIAGDDASITARATGATLMDLHLFEVQDSETDLYVLIDQIDRTVDSGANVTTLSLSTQVLGQPNELVIAAVTMNGPPGALVGNWTGGFTTGFSTQRLLSAYYPTIDTTAPSTTVTWTNMHRAAGVIVTIVGLQPGTPAFAALAGGTNPFANLPIRIRLESGPASTAGTDCHWWNAQQAAGVLRPTDVAGFLPSSHRYAGGINAGLVQLNFHNWLSTTVGGTASGQTEITGPPQLAYPIILHNPEGGYTVIAAEYGTSPAGGLVGGIFEQVCDDSVAGQLMTAGFDPWFGPDGTGFDAAYVSALANPECKTVMIQAQNQQPVDPSRDFSKLDGASGTRIHQARTTKPTIKVCVQVSLNKGNPQNCWDTLQHMITGIDPSSGKAYGIPDIVGIFQSGDIASGQMDTLISLIRAGASTLLTVNAISPNSGPTAGGQTVTITGTNFATSGTVVVTLGNPCTNVVVQSSTSLTCRTPAGGAGTVNVVVMNPNSTSATLRLGYTFGTGPPVVASISPTSGPSSGGTALTINGSAFVTGATVKVGGAAATSVVFVSATKLTCVTPAGSGGAKTVLVTNPDAQTGSLAASFTYVLPPTISAINPLSGATGGGTLITITGSNFQNGASVVLAGVACTGETFVNSTTLTCITGAHATGGPFTATITNPDGQSGTGGSFTYTGLGTPTITSITPNTGTIAGGTFVTLIGTFFSTGATVTIGGVACYGVTVVSTLHITCFTGTHAVGAVDVVMTDPGGQSATLTGGYVYVIDPLALTSLTPTSGLGGGGTLVTLTGTGFAFGATVTFGGVAAQGINFISSTQVIYQTGAHAAGLVDVTIRNPTGQTATLAAAYQYLGQPTVFRVTPNIGTTAGGIGVQVNGTNFGLGATVTFGGNAATSVVVLSATSITCVTPAHAAGAINVVVTNLDGQNGTGTNVYTYIVLVPPPTLTADNPTSGSTTGGDTVTLTGTGFLAGARVLFGSIFATNVVVTSSTSITCQTPPEMAGTVNVVVVNPDGQRSG